MSGREGVSDKTVGVVLVAARSNLFDHGEKTDARMEKDLGTVGVEQQEEKHERGHVSATPQTLEVEELK